MKSILFFLIFIPYMLFANQSILILNSYHKGYEFSDKIIQGLEQQLYSHTNLDINVLYMDSKRIISKEYYENLEKLYQVQLRNRKYDLIIAVDRFAYDFVLRIYDKFFTTEPVFAVGIENFSSENAKNHGLENRVSALLEQRDLKANVEAIKKLMPGIKKLYIINDKSENALHTEPLIEDLIDTFDDDFNLKYLQEDSLTALIEKFNQPKDDVAALFIRFYKNANGELNKNHTIANFIKNAKIPIFITDSIFIEKGATGGKIVDLERLGKSAGRMALDILYHNKHQVVVSKDLFYVYDAQKLEEFILPVSALPYEYEIVNKRETFYDKHRGFINFIFTISPLMMLLILGLAHNIYMRKRVEKDLRERIEFDSVLLNAIESPIFWQNYNGEIVDSNSKFCRLVGMQCQDIYKHTLNDFKHNKNIRRIIKVLQKYQDNPAQNIHFKYIDENNNRKTYLIKQASYADEKTKSSGKVTIFTDITREKEIEKAYNRNQQFTIQQSKLAEIGEVFSSIAHQWKSPLVEITTIAQESFYNCSDCQKKEDESYVKDIMTQVNYMNDTINDFQKFIMPSSQKVIFDAKEAIDAIIEIMEHNIKYNYLQIDIDIKEGTNLYIYGFRNEFMQSFLNLINNAKDALLNTDLKNRKIHIYMENKGSFLIIRIEDNAGGINDKYLHKIFKPYFSTKSNGHGIGLYMSKVIIEDKMNGKISAYNTKEGAGFKIELENKNENISA